jgi:N utilization substance protein B
MAQSHFERAVADSIAVRKGLIVKETEKIQEDFWKLLSCLWVLHKLDTEAKEKRRFPHPSWAFHFIENPIFRKIFDHKNFTEARQSFWIENKATVRKWKSEYLDENDKFIAYQMNPDATFEDHQKFVLYIFRKILFKKEEPVKFFEGNIQLWSQDGETLKNMVVKSMKEQTEVGPFVEIPLGLNWEEDREYLVKLFSICIDEDKKLEEIIIGTSKNWDIDRMAQTDSILLKMAISEFLYFPSIPIKVTINEYLEIAKKYSTPKSKLFINGILDVISQELMAKGEIKKSGRGLIDNK